MRADVYLRQSMDRTGDELGVRRQREDTNALIERRGWTMGKEHVDNDRSAAGKKPRPGFDALLAAVESGDVDVIVAWSLDRLTRNRRDTVRLIETCQSRQVMIALVRGTDIDMSSPAGRLTADVLASVARHEIEQKSDREKRAALQAAQMGKRRGGRRPFGYEPDGVTLRPAEAELISSGYADLLAGASLSSIQRAWNGTGLTTGKIGWKTGKPSKWTRDTVRRVLLNPRNAGLRRHAGEIVGRAEWPEIVPEETWRAAVSLLTDPTRRTGGSGPASRQLLTGVALCGVCGATMQGGGAWHKKPLYRCRTMKHVGRLAEPVDTYIESLVVARLSQPDALRDVLMPEESGAHAGALKEVANELYARLDELAAMFAEGAVTAAQMRTGTERLRTRLAEVESRMADAGRLSVLGPMATAADPAATWSESDRDRRRAIIDMLMVIRLLPLGHGVRIFRPETVDVEWR
jgi:site-specific DNA recombinase